MRARLTGQTCGPQCRRTCPPSPRPRDVRGPLADLGDATSTGRCVGALALFRVAAVCSHRPHRRAVGNGLSAQIADDDRAGDRAGEGDGSPACRASGVVAMLAILKTAEHAMATDDSRRDTVGSAGIDASIAVDSRRNHGNADQPGSQQVGGECGAHHPGAASGADLNKHACSAAGRARAHGDPAPTAPRRSLPGETERAQPGIGACISLRPGRPAPDDVASASTWWRERDAWATCR